MARWMKSSSGMPATRTFPQKVILAFCEVVFFFHGLRLHERIVELWRFEGNFLVEKLQSMDVTPRNLSRLHEQLQSKKLQEILTVLEHAKSGWLKKFRALEEDIKNGSIEAKDHVQ